MSTMSSVNVLCWFNGTLTIDVDNNPTYVNGVVKPVIVRKSITRENLLNHQNKSKRVLDSLDMQLISSIKAFYSNGNIRS